MLLYELSDLNVEFVTFQSTFLSGQITVTGGRGHFNVNFKRVIKTIYDYDIKVLVFSVVCSYTVFNVSMT